MMTAPTPHPRTLRRRRKPFLANLGLLPSRSKSRADAGDRQCQRPVVVRSGIASLRTAAFVCHRERGQGDQSKGLKECSSESRLYPLAHNDAAKRDVFHRNRLCPNRICESAPARAMTVREYCPD